MTPERIAEIARLLESLQRTNFVKGFDGWVGLVRECLGTIESAQKEIADLKRGGVVVPELTDEVLESAMIRKSITGHGHGAICFKIGYKEGWADRALRAIPADRELGEGRVAVGREWRDLMGQLHLAAIDFVNEADPGMLRAAAPMVRAVAALRSRSSALRAQPTQEPKESMAPNIPGKES